MRIGSGNVLTCSIYTYLYTYIYIPDLRQHLMYTRDLSIYICTTRMLTGIFYWCCREGLRVQNAYRCYMA